MLSIVIGSVVLVGFWSDVNVKGEWNPHSNVYEWIILNVL